MAFIFKGLSFFSGKVKNQVKSNSPSNVNPYVKASEDLKRSAEELKKATLKLQDSFRHRQEAMNKLVSIFNNVGKGTANRRDNMVKNSTSKKKSVSRPDQNQNAVAEGEFFEIYREACLNFVETDKAYYFKLCNHSDFLCSVYKRHMGNVRYYDHEFRRLKDSDQYKFTEIESYIANQVIQTVNKIGRDKFVREGHQNLYNKLCTQLVTRSANQ
jgi:hypothetical protein